MLFCSVMGALIAIPDMISTSKNAFRVESKSGNSIQVSFRIPDYIIDEEHIGGNTYHRIHMDGAGLILESGMPELPVVTTTIAIPNTGNYQIQVVGSRMKTYPQILPYPSQQNTESDNPKSLQVNDSFYSGSSSYPSQFLESSQPLILRDFRIITVQVNPFVWDAQTGEMSVYEELDFSVTFNDQPGANEIYEPLTGISSVWVNLYEALILNFDDYRNLIIANTPPKYLIIHGHFINTIFTDLINNYAFWKRQKGADIAIVSTSVAGSSNTMIKNYIQTQYTNPATRPDFIILFGDTTGSFPIPSWGSGTASGDYQYTHLAGTDALGDAFIGRISAESTDQLANILNKVYLYEKNINVAQADWLERMLLVGDFTPSGQSTIYNNKYVKELALHHNPNFTFTELYSGDPSVAAMNQAINQGVGFFNYRGYIGMSGWSPSESLVNGGRLLHAVINTCSTGNFAGGTATTESFIRLGSTAQPKGAVTAIGMATSSTHTSYNNTLTGATFAGIFSWRMRTMGEALLYSKIYFHLIYGISNPGAVTNNVLWCNLMGDPSMEVFTAIPLQYQIAVQPSVHIGTGLLDIQITNMDGSPAEGACLTISQGTTIISRGFTDANGQVIMVLPDNPLPGMATITVSGHNYKPLQHNITFNASGSLIPGIIVVTDDNTGNTSGNGNSIANSGETVALSFAIRNTTTSTISGISGYLTTNNPYVTLVDSLVTYGAVNSGENSFNVNPILINIAINCPDQMMLRMHLILTDNLGNTYDLSEFLQVLTARMEFVSYQIIDTNNSAIDPGETVSMRLTVKNNGTDLGHNLYGRLYTLNDLISVPVHTIYYGTATPGSNIVPAGLFQVFARPIILPGMVIPMKLKLYNDQGFEQHVHFSLTIGVVTVNSPLGPDQYGYVIFDVTDTAFEQCPTYQWIGIAPNEGGAGTQLTTINDPYTSTEGDMVGASSLAVVNLPFTFRLYGEPYNQITVCSNGFIAMGITENAEFRNYRLPGAMGPSPMIAPFWDDLATGTGSGIFYFFDRPNSRFIVQWNQMRSGANGTSENTFQVILYDPEIFPTSTGDGPIKIQYKVFNNIDATTGFRHGNYCTIGITNGQGNIGLEYTYGNQYPTAASPLGHLRALYITTVPIFFEQAHMVIGETYVGGNDSAVEPGEVFDLGIRLSNTGNMTADNVNAVLSTNDPHVSIINSTSAYFPIPAGDSGVNRLPFVVAISPNSPTNRYVTFSLRITDTENEWTRSFNIRIASPHLQYISLMTCDYDANNNGIIESAETVSLIVNVKNNSDIPAKNIVAMLTSPSSLVQITQDTITLAEIEQDFTRQFVYDVSFNAALTPGTVVPFNFSLTATNAPELSRPINITMNSNQLFNNFEADSGNFTPLAGWIWASPMQVTPYSGDKLWCTGTTDNYPPNSVFDLHTQEYTITGSNAQLRFKHYYGTELNYDGGNVAISTTGGAIWQVISPIGGYTHQSLPALNGQPGFSGNSGGWLTTAFNLSGFAGQSVKFRFRFASDGMYEGIGWFIDDFALTGIANITGFAHGEVLLSSGLATSMAVVYNQHKYATSPKDNGIYRLYLPNGTHTINAEMPYHQSSTANGVLVNLTHQNPRVDFTLIYLPHPITPGFTVDNDTGLFQLYWNSPYDPVLPVSGYKVYRKFNADTFHLVATNDVTQTTYTEFLELEGDYKFYIRAMYLNVLGAPSDTVSFAFPYTSNDSSIPPVFVNQLRNNYPNPFNPSTTIAFEVAKPGRVTIRIYNIKGQLVNTLVDEHKQAGRHNAVWNGRDNANRGVASGMYFYRMDTPGFNKTKKMLLMK